MGKSCLSTQATKHKFENEHLATIGFEYFTFNIKIKNTVIKLQIWDTCGQEFYKSLVSSFYRNTSLAIIVYAIDDQKSFDDLDLWIKDLKMNSSPDIKIFLIGNKSDLNELLSKIKKLTKDSRNPAEKEAKRKINKTPYKSKGIKYFTNQFPKVDLKYKNFHKE